MNVFHQCWENWVKRPWGQPDPSEHVWINELNQAVFAKLLKVVPKNVQISAVKTPAFLYHVEAAGGYGVETRAGCVSSYGIKLPKDGTFEERVDHAVKALDGYVRGAASVLFYTPIVPCGEIDADGNTNRHMMTVRMVKLGERIVEMDGR